MPADPSLSIQGWVPILGVFATLIVGILPTIYNGYRADRNARKAATAATAAAVAALGVAERLEKADAKTSGKLDVIHSLVDGRLTAALEKIDRLEQHLLASEGREPTGEEAPKPPETPEYPDGPA